MSFVCKPKPEEHQQVKSQKYVDFMRGEKAILSLQDSLYMEDIHDNATCHVKPQQSNFQIWPN